MNNFSFILEKNEGVFLIGALLLSIPMVYMFVRAGRELMKEPPPNPVVPGAADQRKEP